MDPASDSIQIARGPGRSTRQQRKPTGVFRRLLTVPMTRQAQSLVNGHAKSNMKAANGTVAVTVDEVDRSTDLRRWRLLDDRGRQTWHYLETDEEVDRWPQSTADKYFVGLPLVETIPSIQFQCHQLAIS